MSRRFYSLSRCCTIGLVANGVCLPLPAVALPVPLPAPAGFLAQWYGSGIAFISYGIAALGLIVLAIWLFNRFELHRNRRLEELVRQRTIELESSNAKLAQQVDEIRILSQAIYQSPTSLLITQSDGTILFANPEACRLTGYSEVQLIGRRAATLRDPVESPESLLDTIRESLASGETWSGEMVNRHADGRPINIRSTISPLRNSDGSVRYHLILEEDITTWVAAQKRQKSLETQLAHARRLESIGTLAGGIAHDFNNILTGILGHCELALLDVPEGSSVASDLTQIRESGLRAKALVRQMLTFSRKSEFKLAPIDLAAVVAECITRLRRTQPASIEIRANLLPATIDGDLDQIQQIVLIICTNAAHAITHESGLIAIDLRPFTADGTTSFEVPELAAGEYSVLRITDNGCGMSPETMQRIFDPFFTTKDTGKGTGMGLSIVRGILANHRGTQRVHSTLGLGTTFELYFPLASQSPKAPPNLPKPLVSDASQTTDSRHILLVDDETSVIEYVSARLRRSGYLPHAFIDPRAALTAFESSPDKYRAIVTDLTMPHLTGADLIQRIRDLGATIPAIVITGYGREKALDHLETLPNVQVLLKPFTGDDLISMLGIPPSTDQTAPPSHHEIA